MRINTNFHSDWHGRQVESPQHQPCVAKSRQPNKVGTKPQTETIYNNPTNLGQSLKQRLYITTQQSWDKASNRDYITTQQSWDKASNREYIITQQRWDKISNTDYM